MGRQTSFKSEEKRSIDIEDAKNKEQILEDILIKLKNKLVSSDKFYSILRGNYKNLNSSDTGNQKPETFTQENIIEPILVNILGYNENEDLKRQPQIRSSSSKQDKLRYPDYRIDIKGGILIEAEHFGKDLNESGSGLNQVYEWLDSIATTQEVGIATNGLIWYLLYKHNRKVLCLKEIDLRNIFLRILNKLTKQASLESSEDDMHQEISDFYYSFSKKRIFDFIDDSINIIEEHSDSITSKFYKDFLKLIFGFTESKGKIQQVDDEYLTKMISPVEDETILNKFAIIFMNRLFFIKFMEDKNLVKRAFLRDLWNKYSNSNPPSSFYKTFLSPVFYDVFNKPIRDRANSEYNDIPYLNGGLFRENLENEKNYDIDNRIMKKIIDFIEGYTFRISRSSYPKEGLNPDILGNIYEKTVNLLTEGKKKDLGSYYTPQNVTDFMVDNTLYPIIVRKTKEVLKSRGWKEGELSAYKSITDLFNQERPITHDSNTFGSIIEKIDRISILDPACGSGHFLIEVLEKMTTVERYIYHEAGREVSDFEIKKRIVVNNLYGVDVDSTAVEITKLRIWLSLIESLEADKHGQVEVLPNIEYNILKGDSLTGIANIKELNEFVDLDPENVRKKISNIEEFKKAYVLTNSYEESNKLRNNIEGEYEEIKKMLVDDTIKEGPEDNVQYARLHWPISLYGVMEERQGFDLIIGNPPYGDLVNELQNVFISRYSKSNKEIAGVFVDRFISFVSQGGTLSFIITYAITFNKGLSETRENLKNNFEKIKIFTFDRDKCRVFSSMTQSVSIMVCENKSKDSDGKIYTSKFLRRQPDDFRDIELQEANDLLLCDKYNICSNFKSKHRLPKLGERKAVEILTKLFQNKQNVSDLLKLNLDKEEIWYRSSGNYWYNAWNFPPYESSKIKKMAVPKKYTDFVILIMNSSLFYFYFRIYGDGRDMNSDIFNSFPVPDYSDIDHKREQIENQANILMDNLKSVFDSERHRFHTSQIKQTIDNCDRLLCDIYGLDDDAYTYIINYDREIRNSGEDE